MTAAIRQIPVTLYRRDWAAMTFADQRTFFSKNGFLIVPEIFPRDEVERMHEEIARLDLENKKIDMSDAFCAAPSFSSMIDSPRLVSALTAIFGPNFTCFKGAYVPKKSKPAGTPPQRTALHVDYGILESEGDYRNSNALWVNVLCYLEDLTVEHAPLTIVPGSHNYFHLEPGKDMEDIKDEAVTVLTKAGDAVLFLHNTVHAGGVNVSGHTQHILFCCYRADWARHIGKVDEWPRAFVAKLPAARRRLVMGLNNGALKSPVPVFVRKYVPGALLKKIAEMFLTLGRLCRSSYLSDLGERLWTSYLYRA